MKLKIKWPGITRFVFQDSLYLIHYDHYTIYTKNLTLNLILNLYFRFLFSSFYLASSTASSSCPFYSASWVQSHHPAEVARLKMRPLMVRSTNQRRISKRKTVWKWKAWSFEWTFFVLKWSRLAVETIKSLTSLFCN